MTIDPGDVAGLHFFLMDVAREVLATRGDLADASDLLSGAASLDYVTMVAARLAGAPLDDADPDAEIVRTTLARCAGAALDVVEAALASPAPSRAAFARRYARPGGIFEILRAFASNGALDDDGVAFRRITLASDLLADAR